MSTLLDRMREIMDEEGIKPTQLTKEFGISVSSFTDWAKAKKNGGPSVAVLAQFSERFNVSLDYLVFGKESNALEISNPTDKTLISKFHSLSFDNQMKLLGYIDGMLATTNVNNEIQ